jgi:FkbM family methyltransferase
MDESLEPPAEPAFQPYLSHLPSRAVQTFGLDRGLKFSVANLGVQRWLDRRWAYIASEIGFLAENLVAKGNVVVECGAGYGLRSIALAELLGPSGRLIAFEPECRRHDILTENASINALQNITAEAMVLGSAEGISVLHHDRLGEATVCHDCVDGVTAKTPCSEATSVSFKAPMVTLDVYVQQTHLDPDVLILDATGSEREILRGARTTLGRFPKLWILLDPEASSRDRCSLFELGQILDLSHYDWSVISRKKTPSHPSKPIPMIAGPSYILGVPRPVRYAMSAGRAVGTHPTGTPLESYSR